MRRSISAGRPPAGGAAFRDEQFYREIDAEPRFSRQVGPQTVLPGSIYRRWGRAAACFSPGGDAISSRWTKRIPSKPPRPLSEPLSLSPLGKKASKRGSLMTNTTNTRCWRRDMWWLTISAVVGLLSCDGATAFVPAGRLGTPSAIQRCAAGGSTRDLGGCLELRTVLIMDLSVVSSYCHVVYSPVGEVRDFLCPRTHVIGVMRT